MSLSEHQEWLVDFYKQRDWYKYSPFIRLNFLTEEVGELSRAIRAIEIGRNHPGEKAASDAELDDNLKEEIADAMDQLLIICSKFDLNPDDLLEYSEVKLKKRWNL